MLALGSLSHRLLWSSLDVKNVIIQILNCKNSHDMLCHVVWTSYTRIINLNMLIMSMFLTDELLLLFVCCHRRNTVVLWKLTAEYYDRTLCFGLMVVRRPGLSWLLSQRPLTYADWPQSHTSGEGRGYTLPTATAYGMLGVLSKSPPHPCLEMDTAGVFIAPEHKRALFLKREWGAGHIHKSRAELGCRIF